MRSAAAREKICANVARLLRNERQRQKLSLNMLAMKAGISRQMISYIEQELRIPSLYTLLTLCEALEIEIDEVLKRARSSAA